MRFGRQYGTTKRLLGIGPNKIWVPKNYLISTTLQLSDKFEGPGNSVGTYEGSPTWLKFHELWFAASIFCVLFTQVTQRDLVLSC